MSWKISDWGQTGRYTEANKNKKKIPSFSKPLGPQRLLYFASKTSVGYKRLFHDFSESVGSIPKFLMHAPCNNEPKDISTAFQTKQMLEKSSGQYLGVPIRFWDEPWSTKPSWNLDVPVLPKIFQHAQVITNLKIQAPPSKLNRCSRNPRASNFVF